MDQEWTRNPQGTVGECKVLDFNGYFRLQVVHMDFNMINGLNINSVDSMINRSIQIIVICYHNIIHCNFQFNQQV